MAILYTEAEVENAQIRAQVSMYLISQSIENGFYYFYNPVYQTYKALQYDIYTLWNVIGNELPFITFNPNPSTYEMNFYDLVGAMINKIKQFDVYGQFGGAVNPNYQPPAGQTITVLNVVQFNQDKIPFSMVTSLTLANYNTTYALLYGNNPILAIVLDTEFGNFQYIPVYTYATPGDRNSAITQIDYAFVTPVSGYLSIGGPAPASGSGGTGPGGSIPFMFTEAALVFDGEDWFLPLSLPINRRPIYVESNEVQLVGVYYDRTYSPPRIYGFANNLSQTIEVDVL